MEYSVEVNLLRVVGDNIKRIRRLKGISQRELTQKTGLSKNQVGRIERGEINTSVSVIYRLSQGLDVGVQDLLSQEEKNQRASRGSSTLYY